jgi:hypothetical protein
MVRRVGPSSDEGFAGVEDDGVVKVEFVGCGDEEEAGANDPDLSALAGLTLHRNVGPR